MKANHNLVVLVAGMIFFGIPLLCMVVAWLYSAHVNPDSALSITNMVWLYISGMTVAYAHFFYRSINRGGRVRVVCALAFYAFAAVSSKASVNAVFLIGIALVVAGVKALLGTDPEGLLDTPALTYCAIAAGFLCMFTCIDVPYASYKVAVVGYAIGILLAVFAIVPAVRSFIAAEKAAT